MKLLIKLILTGYTVSTVFITGCTSIPANSPIAKVKCGMSRGEVIDLLDAPCDITQTTTWRKYILPWKTSGDYRTVYSYDGLGTIEFDREGAKTVRQINYTGKPEV